MSLIPFFYLSSDDSLREIERTYKYFSTERPLIPLGIATTLSLLFLCCWMFGVRYRDVYWMIVAAVAAAGSAGMSYQPTSEMSKLLIQYQDVIDVICWGALWAAIYSYLRRPLTNRAMMGIIFILVVVYQMQWLIMSQWPTLITSTIGAIGRYDGVLTGIASLWLAFYCFQVEADLPRKRRIQRLVLGVILSLLGVLMLVLGVISWRQGIDLDGFVRTLLIAVFGIFMMIDLVIFQRAYFEERSLREEEIRRRSSLEDRMELGYSIQRLLMPDKNELINGDFRIRVFYARAEIMAGDWFYWDESNGGLRLLCGDVVGKGPQAAIAATSILTSCHNFAASTKTSETLLAALNQTACKLYSNTPISTVACFDVDSKNETRVLSHGFAGWIRVSGSGQIDPIPTRGPALGLKTDIKWDFVPVTLQKGDRLVIFSDGIADGPRDVQRIARLIADHRGDTLPELEERILAMEQSRATDDDRTLIVIERFR